MTRTKLTRHPLVNVAPPPVVEDDNNEDLNLSSDAKSKEEDDDDNGENLNTNHCNVQMGTYL